MRVATVVLLAVAISGTSLAGQDQAVFAAKATSKFMNFPGLPTCMFGSVQSGDPSKSGSVILGKANAACTVPWHWHTPTEQLMIVSGTAKVEMKDGAPVTLHAGDYAKLPTKHVHQFTCQAACTLFISSDVAFDIHYVDASGTEIPPDQALKAKAAAKSAPAKGAKSDAK